MRTKTIEQMGLKEGDRVEIKVKKSVMELPSGCMYGLVGGNVETRLGFYVGVKKQVWTWKVNEGDALLYHTYLVNGKSQTEPSSERISKIKSIKKLDEI